MYRQAQHVLLISLLLIFSFAVLYILQRPDNNSLTRWHWLFADRNPIWFFLILFFGVLLAYIISKASLPGPYPATLLFFPLSGGEPFLREDLVDISKIFYQNNKPAIMTFPTNGLSTELIKEKTSAILRECKESVVVVKLSLDGVGDEHDAMRQLPGSFKRAMETYEALGFLLDKYSNLEIGINTLFCSENQSRMNGRGGIIRFVRGLNKVCTHTISMVRGDLRVASYKKIDLSQYEKAVRALTTSQTTSKANVYRFKGGLFKAAQDNLQHHYIYQTMVQKRRLVPCYAGRLNLVLTETGDLYPCERFHQAIGNVRENDYDVKKMMQSAHARSVINRIKTERCHCTHECYYITNILFNPKMLPRLVKAYARLKFRSS